MGKHGFVRLTMEEARDRLPDSGDVLVLFHAHPDGDAVGSGFAMRMILNELGCRAWCACADEIPERLQFLVNGVQDSIRQENIPADFHPGFILSVDTAAPSQLGDLYPIYRDRIDLMIDHHESGELYADGWVVGGCSAAGEMVYQLSRSLVKEGRLKVVPAEADRLMYAAISSDTGCFRYSNATPSAHRSAAELLKSGFDASEINRLLFEVKSHRLLLAEQLGFERLHTFADGKIGIVDFPMSLKRQYDLKDEHLETLVDIPRGMEGVVLAAAIRQPGDDPVYRVSMRSSCSVDVSKVCARFGGGGHVRASGCTLHVASMEEAVNTIAEALTEALKEASLYNA